MRLTAQALENSQIFDFDPKKEAAPGFMKTAIKANKG
jgi:hypothetical protein